MTAAGLALARASTAHARPLAGLAALARIEARRLLLHPAFLAGVALSLVFLRDGGDGAALGSFREGFALLPVAAGTLVAANLAALRSRRNGTDELYGSLPRPRAMRVGAQLLSVLATLPISGALIAIAFLVDGFDDYARGPGPGVVFVAQGPAMVVAFGAIGILLARIAPSPVAGPLAVVGLLALRSVALPPDSWLAWMLPMAGATAQTGAGIPCADAISTGPDCRMFSNHLTMGVHLSYLAGLAVLAAAAALVAGRRARHVGALCGLGVLAVALAAVTKLAAG